MALGDVTNDGLLFADDKWATIIEHLGVRKINGIEMKGFLIVPSKNLIASYPEIFKKPGILNVPTKYGMGMYIDIPTYYLDDNNHSTNGAIVWVYCKIDGQPGAHSGRISKLAEENKRLQGEIDTEQIAYMQLMIKYKASLTESMETAKQYGEIGRLLHKDKNEGESNDDRNK